MAGQITESDVVQMKKRACIFPRKPQVFSFMMRSLRLVNSKFGRWEKSLAWSRMIPDQLSGLIEHERPSWRKRQHVFAWSSGMSSNLAPEQIKGWKNGTLRDSPVETFCFCQRKRWTEKPGQWRNFKSLHYSESFQNIVLLADTWSFLSLVPLLWSWIPAQVKHDSRKGGSWLASSTDGELSSEAVSKTCLC